MTTTWDDKRVHQWLTKPLCVRYVASAFRIARVKVNSSEGGSIFAIHWALGHVKDREFEVLGAWPQDGDVVSPPWSLMSELELRGISRLRTVTGAGLGPVSTVHDHQQLAKVRNVQVVPEEGPALSESPAIRSLHPSIAEMVLDCDRLADEIQVRLTASLRRRHAFADRAEALRFVVAALDRADRRLWSLPASPLQGQGANATWH